MISCWSCGRINTCKKVPDTLSKVKQHICLLFDPATDEEQRARNVFLQKFGPVKTVTVLKTHRRASMANMNPAVENLMRLVNSGDVEAIKATYPDEKSVANSHLMIAACNLSGDPAGVSRRVSPPGVNRREMLVSILAELAAGNTGAIPAVESVAVTPPEAVEEAPKKRGRPTRTPITEVPSPEIVSAPVTSDLSILTKQLDAIGAELDSLSRKNLTVLNTVQERLDTIEDRQKALLGTLKTLMGMMEIFKKGIQDVEVDMIGAGKILSTPFTDAMADWPNRD